MTSKLEYLQRYMSAGGGAVEGKKKTVKKVKKSKKSKSATITTRVVDADETWEDSAPTRGEIDKKWEMDAADEEIPLVVAADGGELVDAQDLPVYVDSDKYLDEIERSKQRGREADDDDLSPPRKKDAAIRDDYRASSLKREDTSPSCRDSDDAKTTSRRQQNNSYEYGEKDSSPLKRRGREQRREKEEASGDASPPRRRARRERDDDSSQPNKIKSTSLRYSQSDEEEVESRLEREKTSRKKDEDVSLPRKSCHIKDSSTSSHRHSRSPAASGRQRPSTEDTSPPRRSRHVEDSLKQAKQNRRHSQSESPPASDRHRRVDSLGRDIPPRSSENEKRRSSSEEANSTNGRHHYRRNSRTRSKSPRKERIRSRSRSRSRCRSPNRGRAHGWRQSRSRSPRTHRRRREIRSPSARRRHSPKRSKERASLRRERSYGRSRGSRSPSARGRRSSNCSMERDSPRRELSCDRSRAKRNSTSSFRRSYSRSNSPEHGSPQRQQNERNERPSGDYGTRKGSRSEIKAESPDDSKNESRKVAGSPKIRKAPQVNSWNEKDEKKAGLFTAAEFDRQRKVVAKQKDVLRGVNASELGANAETVYRDKRGRKLDMLNELVRQQEVLDGKRKREEREEYEWGTGEVQKRERKSQQELLEEMKKTPFARHEDDEELERKRRERVRAFDPMYSKVFQDDPLAEGKIKKKKRKKDNKTSKTKPKYAGPPAPPNRFGILPGYRWDGVVRGTNWEEKILMRQNVNAAANDEAYKYAVADM